MYIFYEKPWKQAAFVTSKHPEGSVWPPQSKFLTGGPEPCATFEEKIGQVRSGHGTMTSYEEQPPAILLPKSCFTETWRGAIDANDKIGTWLGQDIARVEFCTLSFTSTRSPEVSDLGWPYIYLKSHNLCL